MENDKYKRGLIYGIIGFTELAITIVLLCSLKYFRLPYPEITYKFFITIFLLTAWIFDARALAVCWDGWKKERNVTAKAGAILALLGFIEYLLFIKMAWMVFGMPIDVNYDT